MSNQKAGLQPWLTRQERPTSQARKGLRLPRQGRKAAPRSVPHHPSAAGQILVPTVPTHAAAVDGTEDSVQRFPGGCAAGAHGPHCESAQGDPGGQTRQGHAGRPSHGQAGTGWVLLPRGEYGTRAGPRVTAVTASGQRARDPHGRREQRR